MEVSRILVFWYLLRFWQGFQEKYCQNLRRYQKNQSLEVKILPKPEEVPKKPKKTKFWRSPGPKTSGTLGFWFFWYLLRFWQGFQEKYCQNPRRYQKNQSLEVKILPKPEEVPKKPKKTKFWRSPGPKTSGTLGFWFFWYLLTLTPVALNHKP